MTVRGDGEPRLNFMYLYYYCSYMSCYIIIARGGFFLDVPRVVSRAREGRLAVLHNVVFAVKICASFLSIATDFTWVSLHYIVVICSKMFGQGCVSYRNDFSVVRCVCVCCLRTFVDITSCPSRTQLIRIKVIAVCSKDASPTMETFGVATSDEGAGVQPPSPPYKLLGGVCHE